MQGSQTSNGKTDLHDYLSANGEMSERIRSFDWATTPLGAMDQWSPSLKATIALVLNNRFPMLLWWGPDYISIYNDAYIPVLGEKHPWALGKPVRECWSEIWHVLQPLIDTPFNGGEATWMDDITLLINRNSFNEETHFTIAYNRSPDPLMPRGIGGVLATVIETTGSVIERRQMETLKELGKNTAITLSEEQFFEKSVEVFGSNLLDLPFTLLYRVDEQGKRASLIATSGIKKDSTEVAQTIELDNPESLFSAFASTVNENSIIESPNDGHYSALSNNLWDKLPERILYIPVNIGHKKVPHAVMVVGLNPYRLVDGSYKNFLQLIADQLSLGFTNALAYETEKKRVMALSEIDKAKTDFFSNISHEFRTPLTLMLGPLEELVGSASINQDERAKQQIDITHRNALRLLKLVNSLLNFSRIQSGRQQARYQSTDIGSFTADLASNFRSLMEGEGLAFVVKTHTIEQPIYIDHDMWEKIVFNLLSNAFKYTLKGSITLELLEEGNHIMLRVADTGVGIPAAELPHMFERFHRVQNAPGRSYEGTGIGLSLIKEMVLLHGGNISVESRHHEGSTFTVQIPVGKDHLPAEQIREETHDSVRQVSNEFLEEAGLLVESDTLPGNKDSFKTNEGQALILVVDDNPDMRDHLRSLLDKTFSIITATNGQEALEKIRDYQPAVVVSDIMMPVMDGINMLKRIKADPATADIPVIFLTARAGEESKIEGLETGADDYLVKPFSATELFARISAQLKIRQRHSEAIQSVYNLFDDVSFAVAVLKGENLIIDFINKYNLEIWQQRKEEVLGRPLFEVRPDIQKSASHIHQRVWATGKRFESTEIPIEIFRNGKSELRYFDAIIDPMFDEQGRVVGQLATSIDVTDKVFARKKIEARETYFRQMTDIVPAIIWMTDKDGSCTYLNRRWYELTGQTEQQALGLGWLDALHPSDKEASKVAFLHANERAIAFSLLYRLKNRDGIYRWMTDSGEPRFDSMGNFDGYIGSLIDVHEETIAQEKIKDSEKHFKQLFEGSPLPKWEEDFTEAKRSIDAIKQSGVTDIKQYFSERHKELGDIISSIQVRNVNAAAIQFYGGDKAELLADLKSILVEDTLVTFMEEFEMIASGGGRFEKEARVKNKKGDILDVICRINFPKDNDYSSVQVVWTDITERKKSERLLKQSEEAYKSLSATLEQQVNNRTSELQQTNEKLTQLLIADRMKDDFIKIASHELRTPITSIKGYVQLIMQMLSGDYNDHLNTTPELVQRSLGALNNQVNKMTRLVTELLDLSRIETGQLPLQQSRFHLNELVNETVHEIRHSYPKHTIQIVQEDELDVYADKDRISQVLINLLTNAIKYSPGKDIVSVKVYRDNDFAAVSVKDDGIGIYKNEQEKIFERFYRAATEKDNFFSGFGIGLYIVREVIQRHGGIITLESEKGRGAVFTFKLPL